MFEKLKKFFNLHLYSKRQIADFVKKGIITAEQYEQIVGEKYPG